MSKRSQSRKRQLYGKDSRGYGGGLPPTTQAPQNTAPPTITGTGAVDSTLTCSSGTWTGTPTPTISYQWRQDNVAIPGAVLNSFIATTAQRSTWVDCTVIATNVAGSLTVASTNRFQIA